MKNYLFSLKSFFPFVMKMSARLFGQLLKWWITAVSEAEYVLIKGCET